MNAQINRFSHVQILTSCFTGQFPIKVIHKFCQNKLDSGYGKGNSWATSPSRSKWDQLEVMSLKSIDEVKNLSG